MNRAINAIMQYGNLIGVALIVAGLAFGLGIVPGALIAAGFAFIFGSAE